MTYYLGIDLGTTYTAAATGRDGRVEAATLGIRSVSVPSVVCLAGDQILVGEPAARRAVTDPGRVAREFKRRVGDPTPLLVGGSPVSAEMLMARVVDWVVTQVAATEGGRPASLAVTHPANWGEYKLDLLRQALRHVGVPADRFVPEPVAAATAYAHQRKPSPGTVVAVYDLGGGTFDAAVLRSGGHGFEMVGRPDGIERLGGIDFDHAVFHHVLGAIGLDLDRFDAEDPRAAAGLAQLREECVEAKEALSAETDVSIPVMLPQRHTEVRLTRGEFEAMIRPALDETVVCLRRAIASAGLAEPDLATVLLVGGSSRIPSVSHLVGAELGVPVAVDARPKDAIALGAALVAMRDHAPAATAALRPPLPPPPVPVATVAAVSAAAAVTTLPHPAPTLGAGPGAGPPPPPGGSGPYPPAPAGPGRRALVAVVAVLLVAAGAAGALALLRDGSGGEEAGGDPTTTTGAAERTTTTDPDDGPDSGDLDLGSSDRPAPALLPGDDWSDAARTQFVTDCADQLGGTAAGALGDLDAVCGCAYDTVSTEVDFASFKAVWSAEDVDTSDPTFSALMNAFTTCSLGPG
jgi:actin-like ATPase involved in cell morphogenesis